VKSVESVGTSGPPVDRLSSVDTRAPRIGQDSGAKQVEKQHSYHRVRTLLVLFLLTLPLVNPWVRGDGVGYYAYVRSLLVERKLDFSNDWRAGNPSFTMGRVHSDGTIDPRQYTRTGHLDNHWAVGSSILWAPFVAPVHLAMLALKSFGADVKPNGFSRPYVVAMALSTALYGFLGLLLSFRFSSLFVEERWAFWATLGIWFASSLPVYMYFNPSWSHAQSVFMVAVFLWYWQRTRPGRTLGQWVTLGLISGLMLDVYYANIAVMLAPLLESIEGYWRSWIRESKYESIKLPIASCQSQIANSLSLLAANLLYCLATIVAFLPTLITRKIIYGSALDFGYREAEGFRWRAPYFASALFSSDHGLLTWTPIMILALTGLFLFFRRDRRMATYAIVAFLTLCYLIGGDWNWDGVSSFGNRFFISLTPLFVLGLAILFSDLLRLLKRERPTLVLACSTTALFVLWNFAFIFQWGMHLIPVRGPIAWKQMVHNQIVVVPVEVLTKVEAYFGSRSALMQQLEQNDIQHLKEREPTAGNL